ncbi:hypothetical protein cypCar_00031186 [Cyprinus carpio]|nr:hypothetical protein cypCar_00031186 [Cyprinus carpio]
MVHADWTTARGLAVTYRPDGQELAVASLDGEITFWNPQTGGQTGSISGRHDLQMGRKETVKITAKQSAKGNTKIISTLDAKERRMKKPATRCKRALAAERLFSLFHPVTSQIPC